MKRRVVVTGMGAVTSLGQEVSTLWQSLLAGKSGISRIDQFDPAPFRVQFAGEIKAFPLRESLDAKQLRRIDRFAQFAIVASQEAMAHSGLDLSKEDPFRCGVIVGSGIGGLNEFEEQHSRYLKDGPNKIGPFTIPKMISNAAAGNISIDLGFAGPCACVSTACATAAQCIGDALRAIQYDEADVMITGGSEAAITPMGLGGFIAAKALSTRNAEFTKASRPFDRDRDGFVLSEGAGILLIEELEHAKKRGAVIYAEVMGTGATADAYHITAPHPDGAGASNAMRLALRDAKLNLDQVDYVNAHGTSTQLGDIAETKAIKKVFGDHAKKLAISSTKSMMGHLLGASGGVEAIASVLSLKDQVLHPTINLDNPDPECDLDYVPNQARSAQLQYAISNSFGFGGHNCTVVLGRYQG